MSSENNNKPVTAEDITAAFKKILITPDAGLIDAAFAAIRERLPEFVVQAHKQWIRDNRRV